MSSSSKFRVLVSIASFAFVFLVTVGSGIGPAQAAPAKCFGKKINKVVKGSNKKVKLGFGDVAWIAGNKVTVIGKPYSRICADAGSQTVRAGKGKSLTSTGAGNDKIYIAKSNNSIADGGLGDDLIVGSKGNDVIYGSPTKNPRNLSDRDTLRGNGGNDRIYDYSGEGNLLFGSSGSDSIYSLGDSVSTLYGGDGSDFLYSNGGETASGRPERLFGERGNDRLNGDRSPSVGPVLLDGGSGDDWLNGGSYADTAIVAFGDRQDRHGRGRRFDRGRLSRQSHDGWWQRQRYGLLGTAYPVRQPAFFRRRG